MRHINCAKTPETHIEHSTVGAKTESALNANLELGNADLQARADVTGLGAGAVVHLRHARERIHAADDALHGVVVAATTGAAVGDSLWREHF